ncbi:hypothetical protein KJE20_09680 [Pyrenophora tritici-repentis]|nr:hypothetical protein KJE20_09680 [Pyrenophora tritici-repentis]
MHKAAWEAKLRRRDHNAGSQATFFNPPCSASAILAPTSWLRLTASLLFRLFPGLCPLHAHLVEIDGTSPLVSITPLTSHGQAKSTALTSDVIQ